MAAWLFTEAILAGRPIRLFNHGRMRRDFTYVDDIVAGVLACLDRPPADDGAAPPYRLYNLGNHRSEALRRFVQVLEGAIGREAKIELAPMQPGDVEATYADIAESERDLGFAPRVSIDEGLPRFVAWYRDHHRV
jgi:UDP-glucuronate 4-epimerase